MNSGKLYCPCGPPRRCTNREIMDEIFKMILPPIPNLSEFTRLRRRHALRIADFRLLVQSKQSDSWPLQYRISEFDFLTGDMRKKDLAILLYSIQCWIDLQKTSVTEGIKDPYISYLIFESQDKRWSGILWPYIYFANSNLETLRQSEWSNARGKFADYLRSLLKESEIGEGARIIKYKWKSAKPVMRGIVTIEFNNPICPARQPIHTFFIKKL